MFCTPGPVVFSHCGDRNSNGTVVADPTQALAIFWVLLQSTSDTVCVVEETDWSRMLFFVSGVYGGSHRRRDRCPTPTFCLSYSSLWLQAAALFVERGHPLHKPDGWKRSYICSEIII